MLPPVVIDVSLDGGDPGYAALLEACNEALEEGECIKSGTTAAGRPRAVAVVSYEAGGSEIRIELGRRRDGETSWVVRQLEFGAEDPTLERWRAVGFAIGTWVHEAEVREAKTKAQSSGSEDTPNEAADEGQAAPRVSAKANPEFDAEKDSGSALTSPRPGPSRLLLLSAVTGPAFDNGQWRFGGRLRFGLYPTRRWGAFIGIGYQTTRRGEAHLRGTWWDATVGWQLRLPLGVDPVVLNVRAELGVRRVAGQLPAGSSASRSRIDPVYGVGAAPTISLARDLELWLGLNARSTDRATDFFVDDVRVARENPFSWEFELAFGYWM